MNGFDFLSKAPMNFIFDKKANKTNLGGVFTMIYLLVVILIIIIYMYDYSITPQYSYQHSYEHQYKDDNEYFEKIYNDEILNPDITFNIKISGKDTNASNFFIYDFNVIFTGKNIDSKYVIRFGKEYTKKLYDLNFILFYVCDKKDYLEDGCPLYEEEKNDPIKLYSVVFNYSGIKIDHQNNESPLRNEFVLNRYVFALGEKFTYYLQRWKTINYTEEKGLFNKLIGKAKNTFYGVEFLDSLIYVMDPFDYIKFIERNSVLKCLGLFGTSYDITEKYFDYYNRKQKDILKSIANICSLSLTAYNILTFLFCRFYSSNFDNKIIQKILFKDEEFIKG